MDRFNQSNYAIASLSPFALYQFYCRAPFFSDLVRDSRNTAGPYVPYGPLALSLRDSGLGVGLEGVQTLGSLEFPSFWVSMEVIVTNVTS